MKIPTKIKNTIIPAQQRKNSKKNMDIKKLQITDAKITHFVTKISDIQLIILFELKKEKLINFSEATLEVFCSLKALILT